MSAPKGRNLNLADGMILVAATAVGLAAVPPGTSNALNLAIRSPWPVRQGAPLVLMAVVPGWLCWTYACLVMRLRRPRARPRRLARQPGFVAGLASASVATAVSGFHILHLTLAAHPLGWSGSIEYFSMTVTDFAGPAVAGAWLTLLLLGAWRAERGPVDRLGRTLGIGWIAMTSLKLTGFVVN